MADQAGQADKVLINAWREMPSTSANYVWSLAINHSQEFRDNISDAVEDVADAIWKQAEGRLAIELLAQIFRERTFSMVLMQVLQRQREPTTHRMIECLTAVRYVGYTQEGMNVIQCLEKFDRKSGLQTSNRWLSDRRE